MKVYLATNDGASTSLSVALQRGQKIPHLLISFAAGDKTVSKCVEMLKQAERLGEKRRLALEEDED